VAADRFGASFLHEFAKIGNRDYLDVTVRKA